MEVKEEANFKTAWNEFAGELAKLLATEIRESTRSDHHNGKSHNLAQTTVNFGICEDLPAEDPELSVETDHLCKISADQSSDEIASESLTMKKQ